MVVDDFDIEWLVTILVPFETNAPLIIDSDAVLALAIGFQRLELIAGRNSQAGQHGRCVKLQQLAPCDALDVPENQTEVVMSEAVEFLRRTNKKRCVNVV